MHINSQNCRRDRALKEQIGCRVETHVKRILEKIAKDEFRTVANVAEKLICERLRDLGLLGKDFGAIEQNQSEQISGVTDF